MRFSPSLGIGWHVRDDVFIFGRYQQAARSGGLTISPLGDLTASKRFQGDTLQAVELGFRVGSREENPAWFSATLSYSHWKSIQADLIEGAGLVYTTNLGDGYVLGLEAQAGISPVARLVIDGSLFVNSSALPDPVPQFDTSRDRDLPDVAGTRARVSAAYSIALSDERAFRLNGTLRYVGPSKLGIGTPFILSQGRYLTSSIALIYASRSIKVSLGIAFRQCHLGGLWFARSVVIRKRVDEERCP